MTSYIHRIENTSDAHVQIVVLSELDERSYDLVLGPQQSLVYDELYGAASAPVPAAESSSAFKKSHIRLCVGKDPFALYDRGDRVRITNGAFEDSAPEITPFAGPGPMTLVIGADKKLTAKVTRFVTGPELAAVTWTTARYALYGVNVSDGTLAEKAWLTDRWDAWRSLGRPKGSELRGPLTAASWAAHRYAVYAIGSDNVIYERSWLTDHWEDWVKHAYPGGITKLRSLCAASWETSRYGLYAVGENGKLYQKWWSPPGWSDWEDLGHPDNNVKLAGPVAAVSYKAYRVAIYALGEDGKVYQKWWHASWSGWESIGAPENAELKTLSSTSWDGRSYVVAGVGKDGVLYSRIYDHAWHDWKTVGRPDGLELTGPMAVISWRLGHWAYYAMAKDGLTHQYYLDRWSAIDGN